MIEIAKNVDKAIVKNSQTSGLKNPESEREYMEIFLEKLQQLLPALGIEVFVPALSHYHHYKKSDSLLCESKGIKVTAYLSLNGIVILKDSQAVLRHRASSLKYPWSITLKKRITEEGSLVKEKDYSLFSMDVEFSNPSAVEAVIHGGQANRITAWKNKENRSHKEIESV
ncbi:MAG: DUF4357 domain-containing protein [Methylotenera sp.]|nr:DUF4357 domain-containing protein [Methylotenera sp.]